MPGNGALPKGAKYSRSKGSKRYTIRGASGKRITKKSRTYKANKAARQAAFATANRSLTARNAAKIRKAKAARAARAQRQRKAKGGRRRAA